MVAWVDDTRAGEERKAFGRGHATVLWTGRRKELSGRGEGRSARGKESPIPGPVLTEVKQDKKGESATGVPPEIRFQWKLL
jgi:hypothetical protein